jgi:hypothetical protein
MALRKYMDKTQALEDIAEPKLYVEKLLKGLTQEPKLKQLQGRIPEEDALRGAIAESREGLPTSPIAIAKPVQGPLAPQPAKPVAPLPIKTDPNLDPSKAPVMPELEDLGLREIQRPEPWKAHTAGAMAGSGLGMLLGGQGGHYGTGGLVGGTIGALLPLLMRPTTIKGPITSRAENLLADAPTAVAAIIRAIAGGGEVSPEDLQEIQAAQRQGKTATTDPRLSIEVDPVENR